MALGWLVVSIRLKMVPQELKIYNIHVTCMTYETNSDHDMSSTCMAHDHIELIYNTYNEHDNLRHGKLQ